MYWETVFIICAQYLYVAINPADFYDSVAIKYAVFISEESNIIRKFRINGTWDVRLFTHTLKALSLILELIYDDLGITCGNMHSPHVKIFVLKITYYFWISDEPEN